jgi:hypothetical protein
LVDLTKLSKADAHYNSVRSIFAKAHPLFVRKLEPLLAWSLALRENGGKPNFNNINLKRIFDVKADGAVSRTPNAFKVFRGAVATPSTQVKFRAVVKWHRTLRRLPPKRRIRGKYEFWFFEALLLASLSAAFRGTRKKMPAALQNGSLFETLSARTPKPARLLSFLDAILTPVTT